MVYSGDQETLPNAGTSSLAPLDGSRIQEREAESETLGDSSNETKLSALIAASDYTETFLVYSRDTETLPNAGTSSLALLDECRIQLCDSDSIAIQSEIPSDLFEELTRTDSAIADFTDVM